MKKIMLIMLLSLGIGFGASAQAHGRGGGIHGGGGRVVVVRPPVIVGGYYPYSPYFGLGLGYNPYYPYPGGMYRSYGRPSKLDLQVADIKNDYNDRIWSAKHDKELSRRARREKVHELKHERDDAIIDAKRNYYKTDYKS